MEENKQVAQSINNGFGKKKKRKVENTSVQIIKQ